MEPDCDQYDDAAGNEMNAFGRKAIKANPVKSLKNE
jgi:hypothetical protein